jgi:hypothetical protein
MKGDAASFIGNIPEHYDNGLGPIFSLTMPPTSRVERRPADRRACWRRPQELGS